MAFPGRLMLLLVVLAVADCHRPAPMPGLELRPDAVHYTPPRPCPEVAPSRRPAYPLDDDGTPLSGSVRLRLHLTPGGSVRRADVIAADDPRLERAACQAVLTRRFEATGAEQTTDYTETFLDD